MLLRRYNNINYILNMDIDSGLAFISKAFEKEEDAKLWDRYLVDYRNMGPENFITFDAYKKLAQIESVQSSATPKTKQETINEINEKVEKIINLTLKGGDDHGV
ncbi:hypothetical protein [Acetobacterium carbinolicum]|uniref:hypothetical protein n=1 Tax=Acetobacterium carbinolicum TaxID=52690 RepID=UPI003BF489D0